MSFTTAVKMHLLESQKFDTAFNHGAGCTFAASIAANLANGKSPLEAVQLAKHSLPAQLKRQMNEHVGVVRHGAYNSVEKSTS